ncbi:hypothetical protein [Streptomyces hokutonensis]
MALIGARLGDGRQLAFLLRPFLAIMGVAPATESAVHSDRAAR